MYLISGFFSVNNALWYDLIIFEFHLPSWINRSMILIWKTICFQRRYHLVFISAQTHAVNKCCQNGSVELKNKNKGPCNACVHDPQNKVNKCDFCVTINNQWVIWLWGFLTYLFNLSPVLLKTCCVFLRKPLIIDNFCWAYHTHIQPDAIDSRMKQTDVFLHIQYRGKNKSVGLTSFIFISANVIHIRGVSG